MSLKTSILWIKILINDINMKSFTLIFFLVLLIFISCNNEINIESISNNKNKIEEPTNDITGKKLSQPHKEEVENIAENIGIFIPENYTILDTISGNLNLDNYNDMVLVLKKNNEEKTSDVIENPEKRPLLILIGESNNKYKLVERNDNSVYCVDCGGMMGDPYMRTVIKQGYFSIEHYGGSAWRWTRIITYKYSKEDNNWFLYKDGGKIFNTSEPEKINETIKTTKDFGKVFFKDFDIYAERK